MPDHAFVPCARTGPRFMLAWKVQQAPPRRDTATTNLGSLGELDKLVDVAHGLAHVLDAAALLELTGRHVDWEKICVSEIRGRPGLQKGS